MHDPQCSSPFMIGSAFGGGMLSLTSISTVGQVRAPAASGGVVGRTSLSEGFSTLPRDRVFVNYSYFDRVPFFPGGYGVHRCTPGFERTFLDGMTSIEFRMPFAGTINSTYEPFNPNLSGRTLMGDLFGSFKVLVAGSRTFAFSAGVSAIAPTADNVRLNNYDSNLNDLIIRNQTFRVQPFSALLLTPNDRFFTQGLMQLDVPTNNSTVSFISQNNVFPQQNTSWHDQTTLNTSVTAGYWLFRDRVNPTFRYFDFITGVSPIVEGHWSQSLTGAGTISAPDFGATLGRPSLSVFNATTGLNVQFGPLTSLIVSYSTPFASGNDDRQYNGQFRLLFNHRFGAQNRVSRVQF